MNQVNIPSNGDELEPSSPYFNEKRYEELYADNKDILCPMCLGEKSIYNGEDYVPCSICNASGKVAYDFILPEDDLLDIDNNFEED